MSISYPVLSQLEDGIKYNAYDFLEKLEILSNIKEDPNFRNVKLQDVWATILADRPIPSRTLEGYRESIIPILRKENLITINNKEEMSITLLGIRELARYNKLPLETYSFLSDDNLIIESNKVYNYFASGGSIPTPKMIYDQFKNQYGPKTLKQIVGHLQRTMNI